MSDRPAGLVARIRQAAPMPIDAELRCGQGEVLALVGPSGSGKSTILRCIAGLHTPASGQIACGDRVWLDTDAGVRLPPGARRVGLVFQHYALFPHLSALDNVREGMAQPDGAGARPAARALLERVNLGGLEHRLPRQLSAGQQQRVAVARALARDPSVLLLDEPFSAVDRVTREKLYGELAGLRRGLSMPVVLVTHDLDEAVMLADRMTLVSHGRTLQSGAPLDVLHRPVSADVARLAGLRNVFSGRVLAHDRELGASLVAWDGHSIRAALNDTFPAGTRVTWAVPSSGVLLAQSDRPPGRLDTPLPAVVGRLMPLGDQVRVLAWVDGDEARPLTFVVPRHLTDRDALAEGASIAVRLRGEAVHLMPGEDPGETSRRPSGSGNPDSEAGV